MIKKPILKKVYNLKTVQGNLLDSKISDDEFKKIADKYLESDNKLVIMTKNGPKYINAEIRSITKSEVSVSCNDEATISFFNQFEEWSKVIIMFVPEPKMGTIDIRIMDIFYIPDYRTFEQTTKREA